MQQFPLRQLSKHCPQVLLPRQFNVQGNREPTAQDAHLHANWGRFLSKIFLGHFLQPFFLFLNNDIKQEGGGYYRKQINEPEVVYAQHNFILATLLIYPSLSFSTDDITYVETFCVLMKLWFAYTSFGSTKSVIFQVSDGLVQFAHFRSCTAGYITPPCLISKKIDFRCYWLITHLLALYSLIECFFTCHMVNYIYHLNSWTKSDVFFRYSY